jgi:hypothetical protein
MNVAHDPAIDEPLEMGHLPAVQERRNHLPICCVPADKEDATCELRQRGGQGRSGCCINENQSHTFFFNGLNLSFGAWGRFKNWQSKPSVSAPWQTKQGYDYAVRCLAINDFPDFFCFVD